MKQALQQIASKIVTEAAAAALQDNAFAIARDAVMAGVSGQTKEAVLSKVEVEVAKLTTQDPPMKSLRLWSVAVPFLASALYALLDPSLIAAYVAWLNAHPGAWWGVAAQMVGLALPLISKALDARPTAR